MTQVPGYHLYNIYMIPGTCVRYICFCCMGQNPLRSFEAPGTSCFFVSGLWCLADNKREDDFDWEEGLKGGGEGKV